MDKHGPDGWRARADELRAQGLSIRQIAAQVGKARATVGEHFKPHLCSCGKRRSHQNPQCRDCYDATQRATRDRRLARVAEMYNAGLPLREIARALGRSVDAGSKMRAGQLVGQDVDAARRAGLISDYRVPEGDGRLRERVAA